MHKVSRDDWENKPMPDRTVSLDYSRTFSTDEFAQLALGFCPKTMDDKWFMFMEHHVLYFHRSWAGVFCYRLTLEPSDGKYRVKELIRTNAGDDLPVWTDRYHIALVDFLLTTHLLHQPAPFPLPGDLSDDSPGQFQHHIAGTGNTEYRVDQKEEEQ